MTDDKIGHAGQGTIDVVKPAKTEEQADPKETQVPLFPSSVHSSEMG